VPTNKLHTTQEPLTFTKVGKFTQDEHYCAMLQVIEGLIQVWNYFKSDGLCY